MTRSGRLFVLAVIAMCGLFAAARAAAYWPQSGTGAGVADVGTLAAPANVVGVATLGSATVSVGWDGVSGPNGGDVNGYYVQRFAGSTPSAACASSVTALLPAAVTGCADANLSDGTYTYVVTAVYHSWSAVSVASSSVTVTSAFHFELTTPASVTSNVPFTVTVTAKDNSNNIVSGYVGTVHFSSTDPATPIVPADFTFTPGDGGTYTFVNGMTLQTAPTQNVSVTEIADPTHNGVRSVLVVAGPPTKLVVSSQPSSGTGGIALPTQPKVTVQDALGNTVTTSNASVTLAITSGTGTSGAVLTCTTNPVLVVSGVATFAGCKIDKAGSGYTLTATATGLTSAVSNSFDISVGPATKVVYTQQPTTAVAGVVISPALTVVVQDAGGNTVTTSSATVTIAIGTNPGGGTLSGTVSVTASAGIATFNNLSINKAGNGYTLTTASAGLTSATSTAFNITFAAAAQLGVTQQTTGGTGGVAWATQPKVAIQDAFGNTVTTSTASVTLAITSGTGTSGAVLTCTANPKAAVAGIATFAACKIDKAGVGYTLTASTAGLTSAISNTFNITVGPATKLAYTQQPTSSAATVSISPAVTVAVQDAGGNTVTTSSATVTIAIGTNPGGGTLSGTVSVSVSAGVAPFINLSINKTGTGYTLVSASTGLTSATSSAFNITFAAAAKLAVTQQTTGGTGGVTWATQPRVTIQDAFGNTITTSTASVTLAITSGTGASGAVLTCTANPKAAASGVATFAGCKINKAGTSYTLTATATGLTSAIGNPFNITIGPATKVVYTQQPTTAVAGVAVSPSVTVTVQDAGGNTVNTSSATVTIAISTNPGGGTLSGTVSLSASAGIATFNNLSINKVGTGYRLTAASTGLTSAASSTFNITFAAAAQLAVTQQTTGGTGGVAWATQPKVTIQDAFGNTVTTSTASVTLAITSGTGTSGAVLTCTTNPIASVSGIATFAGCKIDKAGTNYTLTATATGLTNATSNAFNITVGAATKVAYTQQPSSSGGGTAISPAVTVAVQDAGGNTVTTSIATVTIAIGTNPAAGTLSGTVSVSASAGIATFSNLSINKAGTGYTLTTASTGLTSATSSTFNIVVGAASKVVYTQQPTAAVAGVSISPAITVTVQDAGGNPVTTSTATVTMTIGTNPGSGTLSGTVSVNAVAGVATFNNLSINKTGTGYTLVAASTGLTSATSSAFNITFAAAAQLGVAQQTTGGTGGVAWSTQPTIAIQDAFGNTVTTSTASVTVTITAGTGTSGAVLTCTTNPRTAVAGIATMAGCKIDKAGTGYTLTATATGLTSTVSSAFDVTVGPATKVVYTQQPTTAVAGVSIAPAITLTVQDAGSNVVTSSAATVTMTIGTNPGAGTLSGTVSVNAVAGIATFNNLSINKTGTGYTLIAASTGLTSATSSAFNITFAAAAQLGFVQQTTGGAAGVVWTTQPTIAIQDAFGNTVTTSVAAVTLTITSGTGTSGAVLTCTTNPRTAVAGIATMAGCKIDKPGAGYSLTATGTGLTSTVSSTFTIS